MKHVLLSGLMLIGACLLAPSAAGAFGITLGVPMEQRVGGDYGPEYYQQLQRKPDAPQPSRCRTVRAETSSGPKQVRRCAKR